MYKSINNNIYLFIFSSTRVTLARATNTRGMNETGARVVSTSQSNVASERRLARPCACGGMASKWTSCFAEIMVRYG